MSEECCQPDDIPRILRQVIACKGMAQRMRTGLLRDQLACCFDEIVNHLSHRSRAKGSSLLTLEEGFKGLSRARFGPFGDHCLDRWLLHAEPWSHRGGKCFPSRRIERHGSDFIALTRPDQQQAIPLTKGDISKGETTALAEANPRLHQHLHNGVIPCRIAGDLCLA